jgi:hypothetical protein
MTNSVGVLFGITAASAQLLALESYLDIVSFRHRKAEMATTGASREPYRSRDRSAPTVAHLPIRLRRRRSKLPST